MNECTPSAVINMDNYADHVDFFSIGTNDLTQYTLAVDRGNEKVSQVYCHYDPAVLKLIKMSADSAHRAHKPIYICGEMAVEKEALYFFAGLKISGISVSPRYLGPVREFIRQINQRNAEACINQIISCKKRDKIRNVLKDCINL